MECKNKCDTSNNRDTWNFLEIILKIPEQHTEKGHELVNSVPPLRPLCSLMPVQCREYQFGNLLLQTGHNALRGKIIHMDGRTQARTLGLTQVASWQVNKYKITKSLDRKQKSRLA